MRQVQDFREECDALYALLAPRAPEDYDRPTQFKGWTVNQVLAHLHSWNLSADLARADEAAFVDKLGRILKAIQAGDLRAFELADGGGATGPDLLAAWKTFYEDMCAAWADIDPKTRLKWAGPDMSARSSITARIMEHWAHGQEIFDLFGVERADADRIRNIVVLGVNTYAWAYQVRGRTPPGPMPQLALTAPSGAVWTYGEAGENRITGAAAEFCQVVAQTRNIADTALVVEGPVARDWMSIAQCFAGPPETPPAPGTRFRA